MDGENEKQQDQLIDLAAALLEAGYVIVTYERLDPAIKLVITPKGEIHGN